MTVRLRPDDELSDDAVVLIHMGAGNPMTAARAAVSHFEAYVGVRSSSGLFTISLFAVTGGVTEAQITEAFGHNQFGRATYGALRGAGIDLIATTITDPGMQPEVAALQHVHFDAVLDVEWDSATLPDDDYARAELFEALEVAAAAVLQLFLPRLRKPPSSVAGEE